MRQHPQACAGAYSPTQRPQAAPHEILYAIAVLFTRACFVVAVFRVLRVGGRSLSSLCRSYPARRFCFHPAPGQRPGSCGEDKKERKGKKNMSCYHHPQREGVVPCMRCGASLCRQCASLYGDPICGNCAQKGYDEIKSDDRKRMIIGIGLCIAWIVFFLSMDTALSSFAIILEGIAFGCVPFGWHALTSITPKAFVWLPILGWLLYFFIKLCISCCIGWVCAPYQLYKNAQTLHKIEELERQREEIKL